jgi:hypothetical protein
MAHGRGGASDPDQIAFASTIAPIIIPHNLHDYRKLHRIWQAWKRVDLPPRQGIVSIPQPLVHELVSEAGSHNDAFTRWHPILGWTD